MIDDTALLAWLAERTSTTRSPLVAAVYSGLAERIRRGDFDESADSALVDGRERLEARDVDRLDLPVALVGEVELLAVGDAHLGAQPDELPQLTPRRSLEPERDRLPETHAAMVPDGADPQEAPDGA